MVVISNLKYDALVEEVTLPRKQQDKARQTSIQVNAEQWQIVDPMVPEDISYM